MQVSSDGMSESKSTSISLDVYSSRMKNCQVIYPHRIVRPLGKNKVDSKVQFSLFLKDILENSGNISHYIADNLKRATGKCCLNHASYFPCEYCFQKGVRFVLNDSRTTAKKDFSSIREKLNAVAEEHGYEQIRLIEKEILNAEKKMGQAKKSHIVWPSSTAHGEPRTHQKMEELANKVEAGEKLPPDEAKGVVGKSPLFEIPNFDFVYGSPTEYLHSVSLGAVKRLIELTFSVGETRSRVTTRKLSNPKKYNEQMRGVKVTRECSRRVRDLDFAVMKGQEFRNVILFFVPVVINCIEDDAKERKVWLLLFYMIRACIIPQREFTVIDLNVFHDICHQFYVLYEKLFGFLNCSYNTHIVGCHLMDMRFHGPLTLTSAYGFEAFYGEIRQSFTPGTQSTLKQCFQKIYMKRSLSYHCCENSIFFNDHETPLENDTLIYIYQDGTHKMYKILEVREDSLLCYRQGKYKYSFNETKQTKIDWSHVGVYKKGVLGTDSEVIMKSAVHGKVMQVHNLLITFPNNVLREK